MTKLSLVLFGRKVHLTNNRLCTLQVKTDTLTFLNPNDTQLLSIPHASTLSLNPALIPLIKNAAD